MAGGIFVDQPFHANLKCVVFGLILCISYWYLPDKRNNWMLLFIFTAGYIAMAWYDYVYKCKNKLYSGTSPIGEAVLNSIFKPQDYEHEDDKMKKLVPNQEAIYRRNVYLFHVLVIAPILIYVGYKGNNVNSKVYSPLLGIGVVALLYHGYKLSL